MAYVNVGARISGKRPRTKAELRRALASEPGSVEFDSTAMSGPRAGEAITVATIGTDKLSVCGPDPYTSRKWYATITVTAGRVQMS